MQARKSVTAAAFGGFGLSIMMIAPGASVLPGVKETPGPVVAQ